MHAAVAVKLCGTSTGPSKAFRGHGPQKIPVRIIWQHTIGLLQLKGEPRLEVTRKLQVFQVLNGATVSQSLDRPSASRTHLHLPAKGVSPQCQPSLEQGSEHSGPRASLHRQENMASCDLHRNSSLLEGSVYTKPSDARPLRGCSASTKHNHGHVKL